MNDACASQPEGGKVTVTRGREIWSIFDEIFTTDI
jgi:hypothetical protein